MTRHMCCNRDCPEDMTDEVERKRREITRVVHRTRIMEAEVQAEPRTISATCPKGHTCQYTV